MLRHICLMLVLLLSFVKLQAQQSISESLQTSPFNVESFANLQTVAILGQGQLYAIEWHPNGEILALASGAGVCVLDQSFSTLYCIPELGTAYDVTWNTQGDQLAVITEDKLRIFQFNVNDSEFLAKHSVDIGGTCVVWNSANEIVVAKQSQSGDFIRAGLFDESTSEFTLPDQFDTNEFIALIQANCYADTSTTGKNLKIEARYSVGRTYDYILQGDEWEDVILSDNAGTIHDVAWHIPDETFTYIAGNQLVHFSIKQFQEDRHSGEILRSPVIGTDAMNILKWSPDGTQLLGSNSYGEIIPVWSNNSAFQSADIVQRNLVNSGNPGREARIDWVMNDLISYEYADWYQGEGFFANLINSHTGERELSISAFAPYPGEGLLMFEWNHSYNAYAIFTEAGLKITRIRSDLDYITYSSEIADFNLQMDDVETYIYNDIPCEGYEWIDDRYFSCLRDVVTIIDSETGDLRKEIYDPNSIVDDKFYEFEYEENPEDYDNSTIRLYDTETGKITVEETVSVFHPRSIRIVSFETAEVVAILLEGEIRFWHIPSGELLQTVSDPGYVSMTLHPDGHLLAVGTSTGLVYLYGIVQ